MVERYNVSPPDGGVLSARKVVVPMPLLLGISQESWVSGPSTWVLHFVAHIAVPLYACHVVFNFLINGPGAALFEGKSTVLVRPVRLSRNSREVPIHREQLGIVFDLAAHLVNVKAPEMSSIFSLLLWPNVGKVLVPKQNDTPLGCQEC